MLCYSGSNKTKINSNVKDTKLSDAKSDLELDYIM